MPELPEMDGWLTTTDAATLTGYTQAHIRTLAQRGRIEARKIGRDWLVSRDSLLAYKRRMDNLGPQKHNPWKGEELQGEK